MARILPYLIILCALKSYSAEVTFILDNEEDMNRQAVFGFVGVQYFEKVSDIPETCEFDGPGLDGAAGFWVECEGGRSNGIQINLYELESGFGVPNYFTISASYPSSVVVHEFRFTIESSGTDKPIEVSDNWKETFIDLLDPELNVESNSAISIFYPEDKGVVIDKITIVFTDATSPPEASTPTEPDEPTTLGPTEVTTPDPPSTSTPSASDAPSSPSSVFPSSPTTDFPSSPTSELPSSPTTDFSSSPASEFPSTPESDFPSSPITGFPSSPASDFPSSPASDFPSTPESEFPSSPTSDFPSTPESEFPSSPTSDFPSSPASEFPSSPASDFPSSPESEFPSSPTTEFHSSPASEFPSSPTSEFPSNPTTDFPSSPASEFPPSTASNFPSTPESDFSSSPVYDPSSESPVTELPTTTTTTSPTTTTTKPPTTTSALTTSAGPDLSTESTTTDDGSSGVSGGLSDVEIALIATGSAVAGGLLLLFLCVFCIRWRKKKDSYNERLETAIYLDDNTEANLHGPTNYAESYGFIPNSQYASNLNLSINPESVHGVQNPSIRPPASVYSAAPSSKILYTGGTDDSMIPRLVKRSESAYATNF